MSQHFNITVSGRVQGVFFRDSTKKMAGILGLHGFVQNLPDGRVYIEAEGDNDMLVRLIDWCHHGPELANVTNVSVTDGPVVGCQGFEIRR